VDVHATLAGPLLCVEIVDLLGDAQLSVHHCGDLGIIAIEVLFDQRSFQQ
jgi:hypothetical protein